MTSNTAVDPKLQEWQEKGQQLVVTIKRQHDDEKWNIGDWLVEGADQLALNDEELREHAEKVTGRAWQTLKNYKVASRAFAPSRRRYTLIWSLYLPMAKFTEPEQDKLLDWAEKKRPSVSELEKEIKRLQAMDELPKDNQDDGSKKKNQPNGDTVKVPIEIELHKET